MPVVFMVNQYSPHRTAHAQINERHITTQLGNECPQAKFQFAKVMQCQRHAGKRVKNIRSQHEVAGKQGAGEFFKPGHFSAAIEILCPMVGESS